MKKKSNNPKLFVSGQEVKSEIIRIDKPAIRQVKVFTGIFLKKRHKF